MQYCTVLTKPAESCCAVLSYAVSLPHMYVLKLYEPLCVENATPTPRPQSPVPSLQSPVSSPQSPVPTVLTLYESLCVANVCPAVLTLYESLCVANVCPAVLALYESLCVKNASLAVLAL